MKDKIQTGLRIPQTRYEELMELSNESGVSLNSIALMLIGIGLKVIREGTAEERRVLFPTLRDSCE